MSLARLMEGHSFSDIPHLLRRGGTDLTICPLLVSLAQTALDLSAIHISEQPENDNKNQDRGNAATTKFPRCRSRKQPA